MFKKIAILSIFSVLTACNVVGQPPAVDLAATQTREAISAQVATVVAGTATAFAGQTAVASTVTPTPGILPIILAVLSGDELNEVFNNWVPLPTEAIRSTSEALCLEDCISSTWIGNDQVSHLQIQIFVIPSRDDAVTLLGEIRNSLGRASLREIPIPEISTLPAEAWIVESSSKPGERYTVYFRQGRAIVIMGMDMVGFDENQNVLFLSLFAERQLAKLDASGY